MTKWAVYGVGLLLVVLPGCLALPIPAPEPPAMTARAPIQAGVTTRSEVIQWLGEPGLELPAYRIAASTGGAGRAYAMAFHSLSWPPREWRA
jgi:hypothetical protein